jgi:hypothetical protein
MISKRRGSLEPVRRRFLSSALLFVLLSSAPLDSVRGHLIVPDGTGLSMAEPSESYPVDSASSQFVLGPTMPGKWGPPELGTGAVVTYSLAGGDGYLGDSGDGGNVVPLESFMPYPREQIVAEIRRALDAWEAVADLEFVEIPDDGRHFGSPFTQSGDIRFGGHMFDGAEGTLAHAYFPPSVLGSGSGDIHFDVAENWTIGFGLGGYDIAYVASHEIGHAIGLDHTENPATLMYPYYQESFFGPQADDIAGAVFLYGRPVPEPSAWLLALTALGLARSCGLIPLRRRAGVLLPLPG